MRVEGFAFVDRAGTAIVAHRNEHSQYHVTSVANTIYSYGLNYSVEFDRLGRANPEQTEDADRGA